MVVELSITPLAPGPLRIDGIAVSIGNATKVFCVDDKGQVCPVDHPPQRPHTLSNQCAYIHIHILS